MIGWVSVPGGQERDFILGLQGPGPVGWLVGFLGFWRTAETRLTVGNKKKIHPSKLTQCIHALAGRANQDAQVGGRDECDLIADGSRTVGSDCVACVCGVRGVPSLCKVGFADAGAVAD